MKLITGPERTLIDNGAHTWIIDIGAALGFDYDQVVYDDVSGAALKRCGSETSALSSEETQAVRAYITAAEAVPLPPTSDEERAKYVREDRDARLAASDWIVVKSAETGQPIPPAWTAYRQALRDVTFQEGFPVSVVWPAPPQ